MIGIVPPASGRASHFLLARAQGARFALATASLGVLLAGCATTLVAPRRTTPQTSAIAADRAHVAFGFGDLAGWAEEDHVGALQAFSAGCGVARAPAMRAACARARSLGAVPEGAARQFFEFNFSLEPAVGEGVLTAYFAPEYEARGVADADFTAPVRPRPASVAPLAAAPGPIDDRDAPVIDPLDLLVDRPKAAPGGSADRATLVRAPAPDALAWMRPEELFFLQIQGSGVLRFPDGRRFKAVYAGDNGLAFVAIARPMVRQGLLSPERVSGDTIRAWLAAHAGPRADAVMNLDPRYVFFALQPDYGRDPRGAAGIALPAGRALAIDPTRHAFGELWWIDAEAPVLKGAVRRYRRLAMALDTGSAIRGEVRADLYVGRGAAAGEEAGRVRHTLRLVRLVPRETQG